MCGIAGILDPSGSAVSVVSLKQLGVALAHRGPDGEGLWISSDGTAGLIHRRLAILDTSSLGDQPMASRDKRYITVFNGEIFNFLELRSELEFLGHRFTSDSDTEVILGAWSEWGHAMLPRFNGMWALAIYDNLTKELFLSRDRFGIKPLLYASSARRFAFASEMRAMASVPFVGSDLDEELVGCVLRMPFSVEGTDRTIRRDILRLPAGHCATIRDGVVNVTRWWSTSAHLVDVPARSEDQEAQFRELLVASVRLRMRSDVPIGTSLSGGFDSSTIAGVMASISRSSGAHLRESRDWRHAFVATLPGELTDEAEGASEAARFAGVTPHFVALSKDDALEQIDQVLADLDDIYIGLPSAPWQVYRSMRQSGVVVSLDGHGADELMGGYRQKGESVGFWMRNMMAALASRVSVVDDAGTAGWSEYLRFKGLNFTRRLPRVRPLPKAPAAADKLPHHWGPLNIRLYQIFHCTILPTILRNFDRLSMAHGVEVRMPFMDWRLVTYVMSLPDDAKNGEGVSKLIARKAMAGYLPESIRLNKQKVGFNSPMPSWLNGPLKGWVLGLFAQTDELFDSMVNTRALVARINDLNGSNAWNWESAGRLWPYIHLRWLVRQQHRC
jgi:asparagine synthase (glutamine-hydrolysing)